MTRPRVEILYVDNTESEGYLQIIVNGLQQPSIRLKFEAGNEASLHTGLHNVLEHLYGQAFEAGEQAARQRVCSFLDWARSGQDPARIGPVITTSATDANERTVSSEF